MSTERMTVDTDKRESTFRKGPQASDYTPIPNARALDHMVFFHLVSGLEFLLTYTIVFISTLLISVVFSPFYLLAAIPYAYGQLRQALFGGPPNRLAFPGRPTAAWPRYFPLAGNPKSAWFLGVLWITQWESWLEVGLIFQIIPVLLIPLQEIVNNVLEEILSWFGGNANPDGTKACKPMPNLVRDPFGFIFFFPVTLVYRICASTARAFIWLFGLGTLQNNNHAFVNYAQGLDFSLSTEDLSGLFGDGLVKKTAQDAIPNGLVKETAEDATPNGLVKKTAEDAIPNGFHRFVPSENGGHRGVHDKSRAGMDEAKLTRHQAQARSQAKIKPHAELRQAQLKNYAWVLTKAALLAYERLHVAQFIVDTEWNPEGSPYTSKLEAAWCFDVINSQDREEIKKQQYEPTWAHTTAMLISIEHKEKPEQHPKALILAFRGTEALNNANWFTDFATCPPKEAMDLPFGQVHEGFALALGLESSDSWDPAHDPLLPARKVCSSYIVYKDFKDAGGYTAKRMPDTEANRNTWPCPATPDNTIKGCPFSVMTDAILDIMEKDEKYSLHVTGHSLGAALAHLYTTALLVPDESRWNRDGMDLGRFKALVTQGQPRLGTFQYNRRLEEKLCKSGDPLEHRYMRLVNGDDIVCRVPPLQVTQPPFSSVRGMWQQSGHLVFLPVKHVTIWPQEQPNVMRMYEQPVSYRMSVLWDAGRRWLRCSYRYIFEGGEGNATLLRMLGDWFIVFVTVPLGIILLPFPVLFLPALALIVIGVLEAGMLQGISDHALDGYLNAVKDSKPMEWA